MELKRDIYKKLLDWKNENDGKVLELQGARQTGKTYILDKFAKENYQNYIYINMAQSSGEEFLECLAQASAWKPGEPRIDRKLHKALSLFDSRFQDCSETIVVIDEIQESAKVFSKIREFARDFQAHFIVTGSYLGKTLEKGYFLPAGDITTLTLYTLTFEEFLDAFGKRSLWNSINLYGENSHTDYDELKGYYEVYCQIGGYPAVVRKYLETHDYQKCQAELAEIIHIFIQESQRYFTNVLEMNLFEQILPAIAQSMIREKKGASDLVTELSKIVYQEESGRATKKNINYAIAWLYRSHVIGFCGQANECNLINVSMNSRFYFMDVGVCRYFMNMAAADEATVRGILNENFVYISLLKKIRAMELGGISPVFGTYKEGEIDFLVNSRSTYKTYGVEVKAGKSIGRTAQRLLEDGKVDGVYFMKGDTYGGIGKKTATIPIYLTDRVDFNGVMEQN